MAFQILALSGGGFLGYYTIHVLARLEEETGTAIADHFDLLAGTSVGGIIALALAGGVPARDIERGFEANGARIFSGRPRPRGLYRGIRDLLRGIRAPKYNHLALRNTIATIIGPVTRLGDLRHPVVIPAVDLAGGQAHLFRSWDKKDAACPAVDVAMATSSVPGFFPSAETGGQSYIDGGLFATAPDLLALHEAEHRLGVNIEDIHMLSIGTASGYFDFHISGRTRQGMLEWLLHQRLIRIFMAAQQSSTDALMTDRLGDRYLRIDRRQTLEQQNIVGLDIATAEARRTLAAMAEQSFRDEVNNTQLARMLRHRPAAMIRENV